MANKTALTSELIKRFAKVIELPTTSMTKTTMLAIRTGSNHAYCGGKNTARLSSVIARNQFLAYETMGGHQSTWLV